MKTIIDSSLYDGWAENMVNGLRLEKNKSDERFKMIGIRQLRISECGHIVLGALKKVPFRISREKSCQFHENLELPPALYKTYPPFPKSLP